MNFRKFVFGLILSLLPFSGFAQDFWQDVYTGSFNAPAIKVSSNNIIYTITDSSLVSSTNNGVTWQDVYHFPSFYNDFALLETSPTGVIYLAADLIRKSTDEGVSWTAVNEPFLSPHLSFMKSNNEGFIFTETDILAGGYSFRSEDEGNTWIKIGLEQAWLKSIAFDNLGTTYAVYQGNLPAGTSALFKSTDNGDSWVEITTVPGQFEQVFCNNAGYIFATGYNSNILFRSSDGGDTWTNVFNQKVNDIVFAGDIPLIYISVEGAGVYKSLDGGINWVEENNGLTLLHTTKINMDSVGYLFVMTGASTSEQTKIFRSVLPANIIINVEEPVYSEFNYSLNQNYPNPFNPATIIKFAVPERSFISLKVFDILGNEIALLINEEREAGEYNVAFNASEFTSGVYFYRINAGRYTQTKKMILAK